MSEQLHTETQQPSQQELFGNENERFEALQSLSYDDFKQHIIDFNNIARDRQNTPLLDFDAKATNMMGAGGLGVIAGVDVYFPHPNDKDEILEYALEKSKVADNIQDAAMILGTAVVVAHPFTDGNGRTSRAIYASLSKGWTLENENFQKLVQPHDYSEQDCEARDKIDLGSIYEGGDASAYASWYAFRMTGHEMNSAPLARFSKDPEGRIELPAIEQIQGVRAEDYSTIMEAVGIDEDGHLRTTNVLGLKFALGLVLSERNLADRYILEGNNGMLTANICEIMKNEDAEVVHDIAVAIRQYAKLRAYAAIDFLTADFGGNKTIRKEDNIVITLKEFIIANTNNYHPQRVKLG